MIDFSALESMVADGSRQPRVLDVACGTGILLRRLAERLPDAEMCGVDASAETLEQARAALASHRHVSLSVVTLGAGATAGLPYAPGTFDLITFTNAMQYLPDPAATFAGLRHLLAPQGQLVVEDFARRSAPFPWPAFELLIRRIDPGHIRAYTLAEARSLCGEASLRVVADEAFAAHWLLHGWAIRAIAR
jgi:ubiquinone/menaquinone biosynthesis C-methylase UbiE